MCCCAISLGPPPRVDKCVDGSQTPPATRNSVFVRAPRPPSPPAPRGGRGPGRGAQGAFANQKNRRAQNDLGAAAIYAASAAQTTGAAAGQTSTPMDSTRSLGDLPGRRSCTEEAKVALARRRRRRKLGLAPGRLATHGVSSQYGIIDSDAILVCEEPSLTSFVASDRPSFRIRRVRPRRCNSSENLISSSPAISKRSDVFGFAATPGRYPRGSQKALPRGDIRG